jgi:hypothetical protein
MYGIHTAITNRGVHALITGELDQARKDFNRAILLARELSHRVGESINLVNLANLYRREEDPERAYSTMKESLLLLREIGYKCPDLKAGPLGYCACFAVELGQLEKAAVLFGASQSLFDKKGFRPLPEVIQYFSKTKEDLELNLDQEVFKEAWSKGQAMSAEEAITFALEEIQP